MIGKIIQPQMTQMNADVFLECLICAHRRDLRLNIAFDGALGRIGVRTEEVEPQMTQMNADVFLKCSICAHLRNLRLEIAFKEALERIGV